MRQKILIAFIVGVFSCFTESIFADPVLRTPKYRDVYENQDGTFNWYVIDTLRIRNPILIQNNDYHRFLVTDSIDVDNLKEKDLYKLPGLFLVEEDIFNGWDLFFMNLTEIEEFEKYIPDNGYAGILPDNEEYVNQRKSKGLIQFNYKIKPDLYIMLLMTGKAFNTMSYQMVIDGPYDKPVAFPDEEAYYRVLVPVWNNKYRPNAKSNP